jgi:hypothetical protein
MTEIRQTSLSRPPRIQNRDHAPNPKAVLMAPQRPKQSDFSPFQSYSKLFKVIQTYSKQKNNPRLFPTLYHLKNRNRNKTALCADQREPGSRFCTASFSSNQGQRVGKGPCGNLANLQHRQTHLSGWPSPRSWRWPARPPGWQALSARGATVVSAPGSFLTLRDIYFKVCPMICGLLV